MNTARSHEHDPVHMNITPFALSLSKCPPPFGLSLSKPMPHFDKLSANGNGRACA